MRKDHFFIILLFVIWAAMAGCRSSREVKASQRLTQSTETDVEAHRLDSLCRLFIERLKVHIEFFNPNEVLPQNNQESTNLWTTNQSTKETQQGTDPSTTKPADGLGLAPSWGGIGGLGAVKSIDIEAERTQSEQSLSQADSTAVSKTETKATLQEDKTTVARQDNGTWAIVSVVAAVAFIVALIIVLKKFPKK